MRCVFEVGEVCGWIGGGMFGFVVVCVLVGD